MTGKPARKKKGRRAARAAALSILYQCEARGREVLAEMDRWTRKVEESAYAESLVREVLARKKEVDARVRRAAVNWRMARIAPIERNILRIGVCEMLYLGVPKSVAIDEAVRLAKRFGGAKSHAFVNGILDAIARKPSEEEE